MATAPRSSRLAAGALSKERAAPDLPGALVLSLDFELAWGVFDTLGVHGAYRANLLGARDAIPRILDLFTGFGVAATWATVGFLFAESREELEAFSPPPELRPQYENDRLDPYRLEVGEDESSDPLHFAPSLIRRIASAPRQEIGSHTFSHYLALEPGQSLAEFTADLKAARDIATAHGYEIRSLVMPRHQTRHDYLAAYREAGFHVHRGNEPNLFNRAMSGVGPLGLRIGRAADTYINLTGASAASWETLKVNFGLQDVPESRFLRPRMLRSDLAEALKVRRIVNGMTAAAKSGRVYHLWWHPHNFGADQEHALGQLQQILQTYSVLNQKFGMLSLNMGEAADLARDAYRVNSDQPVAP